MENKKPTTSRQDEVDAVINQMLNDSKNIDDIVEWVDTQEDSGLILKHYQEIIHAIAATPKPKKEK